MKKEPFQQNFFSKTFEQGQRFYGAFKKLVFQSICTVLQPFSSQNFNKVYIAVPESTQDNDQVEEIKQRCQFYLPNSSLETVIISRHNTLPYQVAFASNPVLKIDNKSLQPSWIYAYRKGIFNVNYLSNPEEGYEWHKLINFIESSIDEDVTTAKHRLIERVSELRQKDYNKCYIFGTGPSLATAGEKDWSDGYRIVCNTIVKDPELWQHLNPHFIVAADTIYHFGFTTFARMFREDLLKRLSETETYFVYPSIFHNLVKRYFKDSLDKLIPIPIKVKKKTIHTNLLDDFSLPSTGNILPLLLLPLACTLSKNIYLFGFDGRAPNDQLFWKNSSQHTYLEYMEELQKAHPAFFEFHVPKHDKNKYVKSVHGDLLEQQLTMAENEGWQFIMMHKKLDTYFTKKISRMKILYDGQIYDNQAAGGINRYFSNLITKLPSDFNPTLIIQKVREINYPVHPHLKTITWYQKFRPERLCKMTDKLYFKAINGFNQFDLVHPTYYSLTTRQNIEAYHCPIVLTVYDMIHELYPQYFKDSRYIISLKRQAVLSAQAIIAISENTKKDLIDLYNIPENKISVIYLAPELNISLSYDSEPIPPYPYYLYIGSRAKYKNFDRLLMAFSQVISVIADLKLCIIGAAFTQKETQRIVDLKLENQVENYGYISDSHLAKLYRHSIALVYPSLYEGFGIPPLEAMSCGTTVITSNSSSLPEIVGEAGLMFDPLSTDELIDQLLFLINYPIERDKLIHQGQKRSQSFSWDKTVTQTVAVYQSVSK